MEFTFTLKYLSDSNNRHENGYIISNRSFKIPFYYVVYTH